MSVYTVEIMAITAALQWIEELQLKKVILCPDSCALMSLQSFTPHTRQVIVNQIYETLYRLKNLSILQTFMWTPAHRGIKEIVDTFAKQAKKHDVSLLCTFHSVNLNQKE